MGRIVERHRQRAAVAGSTSTRVFWQPAEPRVWLDLGDASLALVHGRLEASQAEACESTHYDTPQLDLRAAGVNVAVVRKGQRLVQRVSARGGPDAPETLVHEVSVSDGPNLRHAVAVLPPPHAAAVSEAGLAAMFSVRFTRVRGCFPAESPLLDVTLDRGTVIVGDKEVPFSELAVANHGNLVGAAALPRLLAEASVRLAAEDRWERGYRLAGGSAPRPYHARVAPVPQRATLAEAAAHVLHQGFAHFIRNLPAASVRGEAEAVHQMRVGMRRLNAATAIFPRLLDDALVEDIGALRRLFQSLAEVRECDVFLEATLPRIARGALSAADRSALEVSVRLHRASALGSLRRTFDGPDLALLVASLDLRIAGRAWVRRSQPLDRLGWRLSAAEFASRRIRALHRRLLRSEPAERRDVPAWHETRKRAKKLRYAADPLLAAYPGKRSATRRYARRLAELQDVLGTLNDLRTADDLIARLAEGRDAGISATVQEVVHTYAEGRMRAQVAVAERALHRVAGAFPELRRKARHPFVVAVIGTQEAYAAPVAAQIAAAWSVAGLRTAICAGPHFGRLITWRSQRNEGQPAIAAVRRKHVERGDTRRAQRVVWAARPPAGPRQWRRLQRLADAVVVPVGAGNVGEAHALVVRLRECGVPVLVLAIATAVAPVFDATAAVHWGPLYRTLARNGRSVFDDAGGAGGEAQADWLPLLEAIETRRASNDTTHGDQ